ncbi:MAG: hypothetical protein R3D61_11830 [Defluviimonas denitrificans]
MAFRGGGLGRYHSLLDQFWTPWSNRRTDKWGGSLENRTRMSRRIIEGIRKACGEDFIIGLAISTSDSHDVLLQGERWPRSWRCMTPPAMSITSPADMAVTSISNG